MTQTSKDTTDPELALMREECQEKLFSISGFLSEETSRLEGMLRSYSKIQLAPMMDLIQAYKKETLSLVEEYFKNLVSKLKNKYENMMTKEEAHSRAEEIYKKISENQESVYDFLNKLDERENLKETVEAFKGKDFASEVAEIEVSVKEYHDLLSKSNMEVSIERNALNEFINGLNQCIFIKEDIEIAIAEHDKSAKILDTIFDFQPNKSSVDMYRCDPIKIKGNTIEQVSSESYQSSKFADQGTSIDSSTGNEIIRIPRAYNPSIKNDPIVSQNKKEDAQKESAEYKPIVLADNWFQEEVANKLIYFFEANSKNLHVLNLEAAIQEDTYDFKEVTLNIEFQIPSQHRSVITSSGEIYLTGGLDSEAQNLDQVYLYHPEDQTLLPKAKLKYGRSSHGTCIQQNYIYIVGGSTNEGETNSCERFKINQDGTLEGEEIANLNQASWGCCIASFNNVSLYKFGGKSDLDEFNNLIERYDQLENVWTVINCRFLKSIEPGFSFFACSACIQINEDEIYIFGGIKLENKSNRGYIFRPEELSEDDTTLEKVELNLPYYGTFIDSPIIFKDKIYALQNIQKTGSLIPSDSHFAGKRRILCYDGENWEHLL